MASAGGLNASDRHPSQAGSGLSDNALSDDVEEAGHWLVSVIGFIGRVTKVLVRDWTILAVIVDRRNLARSAQIGALHDRARAGVDHQLDTGAMRIACP